MPYQKHGYTNFIIYTYAISKTCHIKNMDTLISLYIPMPYQKREYTTFIIYTYAISKTWIH